MLSYSISLLELNFFIMRDSIYRHNIFVLISMLIITGPYNSKNKSLPEKPYSEVFFGKTVEDPYRYMENGKDSLVQKWFKEKSLKAREVLDNISGREVLMQKLVEFEKRRPYSILHYNLTNDNKVFFTKKKDDDVAHKLYYKSGENGDEVLLYNPTDYKKELGVEYNITYVKPSWDDKIIVISLSKKGEEISEIAFFDLSTKKLLPEIITNCWPSELGGINWLPDNSGIIYLHIPVIDRKSKEYILNTESVIYKIGDNPNERKVLFSKKVNPEIEISTADFPEILTFDKKDKYILGRLNGVSKYQDVFYAKIEELYNDKINWKPLYKKEDGFKYPLIVNEEIYCLSAKSTTNFKIIKTTVQNADFKNPLVIVSENKQEVIDDYAVTPYGLYYTTTLNGVNAKLYLLRNEVVKNIKLPIKAGKISIFSKSKTSNDIWFTMNGWVNPNTRFKYNPAKNIFKEDNLAPKALYPEFKNFVVEEIEIPSRDNVMIPVTIIHKKGYRKDGNNNVLMLGYGAYGTSAKPNFQTVYLSWVMNDGVFVVSHVRGGGEKGESWYKGGNKKTKPNSWNDFIDTAEYLIKQKISSKSKIAITSGSAGGILVGRAVTERPDLFKAVLINSGDMNISRIKESPNGPNNIKEFGSPDIEEEFNALYEMDAFHHIKKGVSYPAFLLSVGMNDARVAPWLSGKFVAKLINSNASKEPVLFYADYDSGHGTGSSNLKIYNDFADRISFAFWQMGHPNFQLNK